MMLFSAVLAVLQTNAAIHFLGDRLTASVTETDNIWMGHPICRVFQSRLLGLVVYRTIQAITHVNHETAYILTAGSLLFVFYVVLNAVLEAFRCASRQRILGLLSAWAISTPLIFNQWFYLWDPIEMTVMTGFAAMLLADVRLRWLALLIALQALNRESSLFMGAGLVLIGLMRGRERGWAATRGHILVGGLTAIGSIVYAEILRSALMSKTAIPGWDPAVVYAGTAHFRIQVKWNLHWFIDFLRGQNTLVSFQLFIVAGFAGVLVAAWRRGGTWREVALAFGLLYLATGFFGIFDEWRIWLAFMPVAVFFLLDLPGKGEGNALRKICQDTSPPPVLEPRAAG